VKEMAKISARGAKEVARYKRPDGAAFVVCSDGRVLYRDIFGKLTVYCKRATIEEARRIASLAAGR